MAWIKTEPHEGILAPNFNNVIRNNNEVLESALNTWMEFLTGGSQTGHPRPGSARIYCQAAQPAKRLDDEYFDSSDLGCLWVNTDSSPVNKICFLSAADGAGGDTWTPLSTEIIAVLLAAESTFAEIITFSKSPLFTKGIVPYNTYLQGRNADNSGNADLIKISTGNVVEIPSGAQFSGEEPPPLACSIANKKYVDDQIDATVGSGTMSPLVYAGDESVTYTNGLIYKKGLVTLTGSPQTITFAVAFPTAIDNVQYSVVATGGIGDHYITSYDTTKIVIAYGAGITKVFWQAWGR